MGYPIWKFHAEKQPDGIIVYSEDQDAALGEGWCYSPTEFPVKQEKSVDIGAASVAPAVDVITAPEPEAMASAGYEYKKNRKRGHA